MHFDVEHGALGRQRSHGTVESFASPAPLPPPNGSRRQAISYLRERIGPKGISLLREAFTI